MPTRNGRVVFALIVAVGIALRLWGLRFGLPNDFTRPDEEKIIGPALRMVQGDLNPHLFLYPTLFVYLTAAVYALQFGIERVFGTTHSFASFVAQATADPSTRIVIARGLSACAGVATIGALFGAARELLSERAALAAAAFLAVAFLHVRDSHFGVTDVPATFLTICAFWAAVRCATRGATPPRIALAGVLTGLAASTKYNAAIVILPALVAIGFDRSLLNRGWLSVTGAAMLLSGCSALAFLAGTPYILLDRPTFLHDFSIQRRTAFGNFHSLIFDAARQVVGERGWTHHITFSLRYGVGLPLLAAGLAGAIWLAIAQPRRAAVVLSFPVAFYLAMGVSELVYARWIGPLVPFLCLTAGVLTDRLAEVAGTRFTRARIPAFVTGILVVLIAAPTAAQAIAFDRLVARKDTRVWGAAWIEARYPTGATICQTGRPYGYLQPRPAVRYPLRDFYDGAFHEDEQSTVAAPDLVVVLDSPLVVFNEVPDGLLPILDAKYEFVVAFNGIASTDPASAALYDQQDAFYVPFADVASVKRPGPTVRIFRRRE